MVNKCHHHVKEPLTFCKARARGVLTVTPRWRCLIEERWEFVFGHSPKKITVRVVRMHYPRYVYHLEYKIRSDYNTRTSNRSEEMRYKIIKSVHVGVKIMYDHRGTSDRDATKWLPTPYSRWQWEGQYRKNLIERLGILNESLVMRSSSKSPYGLYHHGTGCEKE